jgi:hypothetical protein
MAKAPKAGLILLGLGSSKEKPEAEADSPSSARREAGQALIDAIREKDPVGVAEAFAILRDCCDSDEEE